MDVVVSNFRTFAAVLKVVVVVMVVVAVASVTAHPSRQHDDDYYYQHRQRGGRFDPYSLDGGLVTAIAGKGYVLIASDTRLSDGGYNVRTRGHLSSRLWIAGPIPPLLTTTTDTNTRHRRRRCRRRRLNTRRRYALEGADGEEGEGMARRKGGGTNGAYDDNDEEGGGEEEGNDGEEGEDDAFPISADGSIVIPSTEAEVPYVASDSSSSPPPLKLAGVHPRRYIVPDVSSVTFVGSSGCSADCESLKRSLRSEMTCRARWVSPSPSPSESGLGSISGSRFNFGMHSSTARSTATALMQTLYSRRTFPYYSFCVLAGMDDIITCDAHGDGNGDVNDKARRYEGGQGRVHVYDAIGSHERCAAACAGAPGREMLQPILDRLFSSCASSSTSSLYSPHSSSSSSAMAAAATKSALRRDGKYVPPESQRIGSLSLGPPVASCVDCNAEEAVARIVKAYRSVSEREIGIGDDLVVCVLRANGASNKNVTKDKRGDEDRSGTLQVLRFPLKKH